MGIAPSFTLDEDMNELNIKSQTRVNAIMKLNEILEQSEDFALVNFYKYTDDLIKYLIEIYGLNKKQIKFNLNMKEVLVDISTAIPLGLILNELLSDKLKDQFQDCKININLESFDGDIKLKLNYYGCYEESKDDKKDKSHFELIETLLSQFNGSIEFLDNGNIYND